MPFQKYQGSAIVVRYIIIQEDRNPFLPSFNHQNLKETDGNISLLIIAKTKMYGGHCYLGLDLEDKIINRPIYKEEPGSYQLVYLKVYIPYFREYFPPLNSFCTCMFSNQRSQYISKAKFKKE